jgi:acetyl esterase
LSSPDPNAILAMLDAMGPEGLAALVPPGPEPSTYLTDPALAAVETSDVAIPGPHGDVPARIYRRPTDQRGTALVWAHGGGFFGGDIDMPESHWVSLSIAARGFGVLSVDYRKCVGGVHYPVPSDDVLAAWQWATAHADELGASPERLHLGGASAGGSLAAGVTKRIRDNGGILPASLILVYPTVHAELPPMSDELAAATEPLRQEMPVNLFRWMNLNYVGAESLFEDQYAFPGLGDVGRQPAVYILNSDTDPLRASGEAYGVALDAAGVAVKVELEPGTSHGHINEPLLPEARRSVERIVDWLDTH